jgi:hypothetical protein
MGSTLAFRTGFAHGRRKNALAEEINRSPTAKRETVIICNDKKNKGMWDEKEWKRGQL